MNKCPNCGFEGEDKFCPKCGSAMESAEVTEAFRYKCSKCGTESNNDKCPNCGLEMKEKPKKNQGKKGLLVLLGGAILMMIIIVLIVANMPMTGEEIATSLNSDESISALQDLGSFTYNEELSNDELIVIDFDGDGIDNIIGSLEISTILKEKGKEPLPEYNVSIEYWDTIDQMFELLTAQYKQEAEKNVRFVIHSTDSDGKRIELLAVQNGITEANKY